MSELQSVHLALFFCERAFSKHRPLFSRASPPDDLGMWLLHHTVFYNLLGKEDLSGRRDLVSQNQISSLTESASFLTEGEGIFNDFLGQCFELGGLSLFSSVLQTLCDFLYSIFDTERCSVSLHMLSDLFIAPSIDVEAGKLPDNSFSRFRNWFFFSWKSSSFEYQLSLTSPISDWIKNLTLLSSLTVNGPKEIIPRARSYIMKRSINIRELHESLQVIFEGKSYSFQTLSHYLLKYNNRYHGNSHKISNLLEFFNENDFKKGINDLPNSPQSVMINIACGMLLYEKTYLQLRALENALVCAEGAVLIEHQFYTTTIIALSHLSCFEVHLASCNALKAADSIAMALQLIRQKRDTVDGYLVSLFYLCAAHLLLLFPGAVGSSLRSLLQPSEGGHELKAEVQSPSIYSSGSPVVDSMEVQTVPQSVLHALLLSELQSIHHHNPKTLSKELTLYVMRSTVIVQGSLYGMVAPPLSLSASSIRALLEEVLRTGSVTLSSSSAIFELIPELTRNVAHTALCAQEGTLTSHTHPLKLIKDYLEGVRDLCGIVVLEKVQLDFFFRGVAIHLIAGWLFKNGFISAAYDTLEDLVEEIYFQARIQLFSSEEGPQSRRRNADEDAILFLNRNTGKLLYWPPDHLVLYVYVQMKRAEIASYLHYTDDMKLQRDATRAICANAQFAFGVLASEYIDALFHYTAEHFTLVVDLTVSLETAAKRIGYVPFQKRVSSVRIAALIKCGNSRTALFGLDSLHPIPPNLMAFYLNSRLNAILNILSCSIHLNWQVLEEVVQGAVSFLKEHFLVGGRENFLQSFSSCPCHFLSILELSCLHNSVLKALELLDLEQYHDVLSSDLLMVVLKKRHLLHGIFTISPHLLDSVSEILFALVMKNQLKQVETTACLFITQYYQKMDVKPGEGKMMNGDRLALLKCYEAVPNIGPPVCEWNGHRYDNLTVLEQHFMSLGTTSHKIDVIDAQPIPLNDLGMNQQPFIITVHGTVTYEEEHKREFFQRFVVLQTGEKIYHILNDYYRWLSEAL